MYVCAICNREVSGEGAFLPGESSDFVCMSCFRARTNHSPMEEDNIDRAQVIRYGIKHRPGKPIPKKKYNFVVSPVNTSTSKVIKRIKKKNILTAKNLPPGSYSF